FDKKEVFLINHSFAAPIATVFAMWTDPKHLVQWLPPAGFTMEFLKCDLRQGGSSFYRMSAKNGVTMYGRANYLEITPTTKLVYTQQFCDQHQNVARHPAMPTWPETMLTTVRFAEEPVGSTRVMVT